MAALHPTISRGYRDATDSPACCTLVASDIAEAMLRDGVMGSIYSVQPSPGHTRISPRSIPHVSWGGHVVCAYDGQVYDPIHDRPLPLAIYLAATFSEPALAQLKFGPDRIEDFVRR